MNIGDLVRIKHRLRFGDGEGKLAVVVNNGTWSADVLIIEDGREIRISKENLEVLC